MCSGVSRKRRSARVTEVHMGSALPGIRGVDSCVYMVYDRLVGVSLEGCQTQGAQYGKIKEEMA